MTESIFVLWLRVVTLLQSTVIEQLPNELRERFTEMREMDLQVQSTRMIISTVS